MKVLLKELDAEFELGRNPVQALGTIRGRGFFFLAKHSNWKFEVSNDVGELPSDVGGNEVFCIGSRHKAAGEMADSEAATIIEQCIRLFLEVAEPQLKVLGS